MPYPRVVPRTFRQKPPHPVSLGGYDLDAVTIELGADETELDFRLELGEGLGIYWALPASRNGRLRLAHVDGAAYDLPEPVLIADPWCCDLLPLAWSGELGPLDNGRRLVGVRIEASANPAAYCCELVTRRDDTDELVTRFAWTADDPWHDADATTRVALLDQRIAQTAAAEQIDLGAIAFIHQEGGRLFDEQYLDGAQYALVHDLFAAARRADLAAIRVALACCQTWSRPAPPRARQAATLVAGAVASGHRGPVTPPAFAPDGKRFVACDRTGLLVVHERRGEELVAAARCKVEPARVSSRGRDGGVAWSPTGERIAVHERTGVRMRDPRDLSELGIAGQIGDGALAFGGAGTWLAALDAGRLTILAMPALTPHHVVFTASGDAMAVAPLGDLAVVVDGGGTEETAMGMTTHHDPATITVLQVGAKRTTTIAPGGPVRDVVYDRWRQHVIASRFGGEIAMWTPDGAPVRRFQPYDVGVRALAVTEHWLVMIPDRPIGDAVLDLWSIDGTERVASAPIPGGLASSWVVASPDGNTLLTPERPARGNFGIRTWTIG